VVEAKRKPPDQIRKQLHHEVVRETQRNLLPALLIWQPRRGAVILSASTGGLRFATTTGYFLANLRVALVS